MTLDAINEFLDAEDVYIKPNISQKVAYGAISSYATGVTYDEIDILIDDSAFNSGKNGICITHDAIYLKEDLEKPKKFLFSEIDSCRIKKGFISYDLIINDKKVGNFTRADKNEMVKLFEAVNEYIQQAKENPAYHGASDSTTKLLKKHTNDSFIQQLQGNLKVSNAVDIANFALGFFTGYQLPEGDKTEYLAKSILHIRKNNIQNRAVMELANNFATNELIIYSLGLLRQELQDRGMGENQNAINNLLFMGLKTLFKNARIQAESNFLYYYIDRSMELLDIDSTEAYLLLGLFISNHEEGFIEDLEEGLTDLLFFDDELCEIIKENAVKYGLEYDPDDYDDSLDDDSKHNAFMAKSIVVIMKNKLGNIDICDLVEQYVDKLLDA